MGRLRHTTSTLGLFRRCSVPGRFSRFVLFGIGPVGDLELDDMLDARLVDLFQKAE